MKDKHLNAPHNPHYFAWNSAINEWKIRAIEVCWTISTSKQKQISLNKQKDLSFEDVQVKSKSIHALVRCHFSYTRTDGSIRTGANSKVKLQSNRKPCSVVQWLCDCAWFSVCIEIQFVRIKMQNIQFHGNENHWIWSSESLYNPWKE